MDTHANVMSTYVAVQKALFAEKLSRMFAVISAVLLLSLSFGLALDKGDAGARALQDPTMSAPVPFSTIFPASQGTTKDSTSAVKSKSGKVGRGIASGKTTVVVPASVLVSGKKAPTQTAVTTPSPNGKTRATQPVTTTKPKPAATAKPVKPSTPVVVAPAPSAAPAATQTPAKLLNLGLAGVDVTVDCLPVVSALCK